MVHTVCVEALAGGWAVSANGFGNDMLFLSGEAAEAAARKLAGAIAASGETVELEIWLRDGRLAGRFMSAPVPEALAIAG
jgi:hypothetical protein